MPKEITDKLVWLFLLLPGFLSVALVGLVVDLGQLSEFQITFYSFILTLIDVAIALPLISVTFKLISVIKPKALSDETRTYVFGFVTVIVSILIGIFLGLAAEKDRFFVTLRALPITDTLNKRSSSRPLVFLLSQNTAGRLKTEGDARPAGSKQTEAWARVEMKGGKRYEGWPEFYEIGSKSSEIYLSPACEVASSNPKSSGETLRPIAGPGVILYESEIQSVEFLDRSASPCFAHWFPRPKKNTSVGPHNPESPTGKR